MNKDMPTDGFEWVEDLTEVPTVGAIDPEAEKDYILEVELDYPQKLHDAHNDYPSHRSPWRLAYSGSWCQTSTTWKSTSSTR